MRASDRRHVLLTGPPGCGKTTVLSAALSGLREAGWLSFGFWTPEIRLGRIRQGFEARLLSGDSAVLASQGVAGDTEGGSVWGTRGGN